MKLLSRWAGNTRAPTFAADAATVGQPVFAADAATVGKPVLAADAATVDKPACATRSDATLCSTSRSASGAHATVVGQKPVTPNFGRRSAIAAITSPPSSVSRPSSP